MRYAKLETGARFNLASSGVADAGLADLGPLPDGLALHGDNPYGWPPLVDRVAGRYGIPADCVVMPGGGASFAHHLAFAGLIEPGDEAIVEEPAYELLVSALSFLGAKVRRFQRRLEDRWALDPERIASQVTEKTRLIVLTNLHNPSGAPAETEALAAIEGVAERAGAWIICGEVYLELLAQGERAPTAFRPAGRIVATSSLTKAYGLSGLRCGWILAPSEVAERLWRLNDLFAVKPAHLTEQLSLIALDRLPDLRRRAQALLGPNRAAYREILGEHPALEQVVFDDATTVFPRLRGGDADGFCRLLRERFETGVVPGRFFGASTHIRIGLGGDPAATREGLARIAEALSG